MGAVEDGAREEEEGVEEDCGRLELEGALEEGALEEEEDACEDEEGVEDDSSGWEGALLDDSKEEEELGGSEEEAEGSVCGSGSSSVAKTSAGAAETSTRIVIRRASIL